MTPLPAYNFSQALEDILEEVKSYYPDFDAQQEESVRRAFRYGLKFFKNKKRRSGEPYFSHAVETTKILLALKPDRETVIASLLYNTIRDSSAKSIAIEKEFGPRIAFLCEEMQTLHHIKFLKSTHTKEQFNDIRKLMVMIAQDIRVLFVKLSARIHNLRTLQYISKEKADAVAREAQEIFVPVAEKLGLFEFKTEIEDLCFAYLQPEAYQTLKQEIEENSKEKKNFLVQAKKEISALLAKQNFEKMEIQARQKNISSVYEKMKRRNFSSAQEVQDLFGFRILVPSVEDCYQILGILHTQWKPLLHRLKDYIAVPKPNGYQSLHTTLLGVGGNDFPTEIQIRTFQMHSDAELGPAAHWAYKKAKHSNFDQEYLKRMSWIPTDISYDPAEAPEKLFQVLANNLIKDQIYVFTSKGDVEILPNESTPIDFAYTISTELGHSCIGAKVNGIIKPLNSQLHSGDRVEILTQKGRKPNPAWFYCVHTQHAKDAIRHAVEENNAHASLLDPLFIKPEQKKKTASKAPAELETNIPSQWKNVRIIIGGAHDIPYQIAPCCKIGRPILAYKSRGLDFTIHNYECPHMKKLDPARILEAHFVVERSFEINVFDRVGMYRDYTAVIANHGINISNQLPVHYTYDANHNRIGTWQFSIEACCQEELDKVVREIEKIPSVIRVKPIDLIKSSRIEPNKKE